MTPPFKSCVSLWDWGLVRANRGFFLRWHHELLPDKAAACGCVFPLRFACFASQPTSFSLLPLSSLPSSDLS